MIILKENFKLRENEEKEVTYTTSNTKEDGLVHHFSYFACTCSDENAKYWKDKLNDEFKDYDPEVHADFTSQLAMEIAHTFNGGISISADMWFGISAYCSIRNGDAYESVIVDMQCDEIAFGLLAIVEILRKVTNNATD